MYATMKTLEAAEDPRVLILRYEDLVKNTSGTLKVCCHSTLSDLGSCSFGICLTTGGWGVLSFILCQHYSACGQVVPSLSLLGSGNILLYRDCSLAISTHFPYSRV